MKLNGIKKKGYFSLQLISLYSTIHKIIGKDSFNKDNFIFYENQERKTSPPFLNIFWI